MDVARRNLRLLDSIEFFSKFVLFQGVLAVYYASVTGSYALAMAVFSVAFVSSAVFELPTGLFSDYVGRKLTVVFFCLANAVAMLLYYLADSMTLLVVGALFEGCAMALRSGTITAYVYESVEALGAVDNFAKYEGSRRAFGYWGEVVSGILGAGVIYFFDLRTAVLVTSIVFLGVCVATFWLTEPAHTRPGKSNIYADIIDAWRKFKGDVTLRNISLAKIIGRGSGNVEYRFRALLFSAVMPVWATNLLGVASDLATGLAMKYSHTVVRKLGFMTSLVHFELFDRIATALLVMVNSITSLSIMNLITSVVYGVREIAAEDLLQGKYLKEKRATMGSIIGLTSSLLYGALGVLIGFLADHAGLINTMLIMQAIMATAAFFYYRGIVTGLKSNA